MSRPDTLKSNTPCTAPVARVGALVATLEFFCSVLSACVPCVALAVAFKLSSIAVCGLYFEPANLRRAWANAEPPVLFGLKVTI